MNKTSFKKSVKLRKQHRELEFIKYQETFVEKILIPKLTTYETNNKN